MPNPRAESKVDICSSEKLDSTSVRPGNTAHSLADQSNPVSTNLIREYSAKPDLAPKLEIVNSESIIFKLSDPKLKVKSPQSRLAKDSI